MENKKKKGVIQIFNMTSEERKCWKMRVNSFTDKSSAESKTFYKALRAKARIVQKNKHKKASVNEIMMLLFSISYASTPAFLNNLETPQDNKEDFNPDKIKEFEVKRWKQRYDGFEKSSLSEDGKFMDNIKKFADDHYKQDKTHSKEIYRLWLFIISYTQTGFWADDILNTFKKVKKVMN